MELIPNTLAFRNRKRILSTPILTPAAAGYARLIPGTREKLPSEFLDRVPAATAVPRGFSHVAREFLPKLLQRFHAAMLIPATADLTLLLLGFFAGRQLLVPLRRATLISPLPAIYCIAFFVFAAVEDLYTSGKGSSLIETAAAVRTLAWTTLFTMLSISLSQPRVASISVLIVSFINLIALVLFRHARRAFSSSADSRTRNVLIIGNGKKVARVADAIRREPNSFRSIKGFMADNHLRNIYGSSMLRRIAREEFIDELIVVSSDPTVVRLAIEQGRLSALDLRIAPVVGSAPLAEQVAVDYVGRIPLLKIQDHRAPESELAIKRGIDILGAVLGLIVLAPVFLLLALVIKLDSAGPVFYNAPRTGRKGRSFTCYKFRTMVHEANARKDGLRSENEREGVFFKIARDPRVTPVGRFLRRYSLDELPQLWNVLLGDMSLVGPRPHPTDDVSLYEAHHLQRLDFVPGITGLWQVNARRDPSFERSVALDVEYIRSWNLWLDATILWRTVFAVLDGTGA